MSDPKRIVLIGPMHPYRGGIAHFLETMYSGFGGRGHHVEAITYTRQYPEILFPGKTQMELEPVEDPVPARRLIDTINPASWFSAASKITDLKPDAIVLKFWMPFFGPAYGTIARRVRKSGVRVIAVVDNAIPHERRPGDLTLARYFLRACDGCVTMSASVTRDLTTLGVPAAVREIKHPVYDHFGPAVDRLEARAGLGLPSAAPVLLFFGFVRRYKGLHVLISAMPKILKALPAARLVVAGEFYDDREQYEREISDLGIGGAVELHADYIPNSAVARYFCAADVVVQPYVTATQSGVAQIAFNYDKPAIITDVGGLAEVVPDGRAGLVVPPEDPEALANAVIRYFQEGLADKLADGVRLEKPKYSWDRLYEAVEDLIR